MYSMHSSWSWDPSSWERQTASIAMRCSGVLRSWVGNRSGASCWDQQILRWVLGRTYLCRPSYGSALTQ
jgi:hypothetical protein